ncbi:Enhancer of polycomb-like transcription factor protein [Thalictrum thalictroides]|uniref:Enhancer of polycomb-like protein n=1 Tax=Thalictrum thalictroides TaxID=46969 RepID=A0A7J6X2P8_THATH|nr:Enhancer of polycomb-like transcription factor protein [Thalictrum thalictroides]
MENSARNSEILEIPKKTRSLDLQSLYVEKGEGSGLKRKTSSSISEEFGWVQSKKKKRSWKEVSHSSFESEYIQKSEKRPNVGGFEVNENVLKKKNDQVSEEGNLKNLSSVSNISSSFDANVIPIPKRPRCFTRRKKIPNNYFLMQDGASEEVSSDAQSAKLTGQSVTPILSSEGVTKYMNADFKEINSSRASSAQSSRDRDSASVRYPSKTVRRDREKRREIKSQGTGVDRRKLSANNPIENLQEDEEENLEENAARMLSSRFDPRCTVFSGNGTASASQPVHGLSAVSSIRKDFLSFQSNHSPGSEDNGTDAAGRVLRPRRKEKKNRHTRKRRHFYEIFSREIDVYWVVNRRIKVFWPLDKTWYFGLVTSYDQQRKLHHVKYDDRDEEWINLQTERFKLLLLPSEAPRKHSGKLGVVRSVAEEKEDVEAEDDNDISGCKDSEPIISWLTQSARGVKSSHLGVMKRRKLQSESENITMSSLSEESASTYTGSLVSGHFRADANISSSDSGVPENQDDKEISETSCSQDKMLRFVYSRKRLRQGGQGLHSTSDNSDCRSIIVYAPHVPYSGRLGHLEDCNIAHQCFGVDDLDPGCVLWSGENLGLLKLIISPINSRQVILKVSLQLQFAVQALEFEDLWVCHNLLLLQYGIVKVMWPKVQLEMLFVDNVVGLRFLLFEGCLMQAVAFVCLVLVAFHQPNKCGELLDQQIPVTSIRFEISGFPNSGRRFIFVLYNFVEVRNSKWSYLDKKLNQYCIVTKQLPLSECTYDNIKILQNRRSLVPSPSVHREPISVEGSQKRSRPAIMHKRISKESAYVNMGLLSSSCNESPKRVPHFLLPFAAAPSFFLGLHLKLLMAKNVASIIFCNPLLLLEGPENSNRLVAEDDLLVEEIPDPIIPENNIDCSLTRTAAQSGLLSSPELKVDVDDLSMNNEGDRAISLQKCQDIKSDVTKTSVTNLLGSEHCASSWPPVEEGLSYEERPKTGLLSHLNGIKVQIPTIDQVENQSCDGVIQDTQLSTPDSVWSVSDCAIRSPNPTGPRSIWHRNRHSSSSLSFGYRSKMWPDGRVDSPHNGLVNDSRKPRSQISYLLPFGNYDFSSKPRSHHRKGRPYKRIKTDGEKTATHGSGSPQSHLESLSCDANVLITVGDRGWRECGAHVLLECVDPNEWRLLVNISGHTKYSYKAYQFLQPGTTNRYTHAMMWKGGKDWILEFPDRSQWTLFKEMHEECYNQNLRAASVKSIPIPGVRLIEDIDDNGVEVPFVRISPKYFMQVETDVDMALNPSRILYDMDSDDEDWISKHRTSSDATVSNLTEISEEMFERTIDMFEKLAYTQQREDFTGDEIEELMVGGEFDLIIDIYEYWKHKRQMKGMPLIRHLQSPLWERYQQQLKEWELAVNKIHHFPSGCKEKAMLLEKPAMFAFCLRPRGLEVPNKGSKQRSQRKVSAGGQSCGFSRDSEGQHVFGRKSNGFVCGDERLPSGSNHEYASSWQVSTRVISPRDAVSTGYLSMSSDGSERSQSRRLHRNKSRKIGTFISHNNSQMIVKSYNHRLVDKRNVVSRWNVGLPEWSSQNQYQREGIQRPRVEKLGGPDLDEFRLRDASSAAQHASNMAKLKREKAQRLHYRADLAIHKATVALMTAEALKASSEDSTEDG